MKATLVESHELAPDVRHFSFEVKDVDKLDFKPGQFVSFNHTFDGKNITRAYSIASRPNGNRFDLCLNVVRGGLFSPHLFTMNPGDSVDMTPPLGFFTLRNPGKDALFIATGTGIAPFRSMAPEYLAHRDAKQLTLLFGIRYENSIYYGNEFEALAARYPNFEFWPTLSRPEPSWPGRAGHVQTHLLEALGERRDVDVYICGLKAMVDDVRSILKALGFDRKQIIFEKYD